VFPTLTSACHRAGAQYSSQVTISPVETLRKRRLTLCMPFTLSSLMSALQSVFGRSHARHKLTGFISHTTMYFLALAYTAALCINLFGCVFYFTARVEGIANGNTWLSAVGASDLRLASGSACVGGSNDIQLFGWNCAASLCRCFLTKQWTEDVP